MTTSSGFDGLRSACEKTDGMPPLDGINRNLSVSPTWSAR